MGGRQDLAREEMGSEGFMEEEPQFCRLRRVLERGSGAHTEQCTQLRTYKWLRFAISQFTTKQNLQ